MQRRITFIVLVLLVSLAVVCVESVVMAARGTVRFGLEYPVSGWPSVVEDEWPERPHIRALGLGTVMDANLYKGYVFDKPEGVSWTGYELAVIRVGWPARCFVVERTYMYRGSVGAKAAQSHTDEPPSAWQRGLKFPAWASPAPNSAPLDMYPRHIPLRPVMIGLVTNTLVHGCIVGPLMLVPGGVRRLIRSARGRCPACGYALAGLQKGAACPECGSMATAARKSRKQ